MLLIRGHLGAAPAKLRQLCAALSCGKLDGMDRKTVNFPQPAGWVAAYADIHSMEHRALVTVLDVEVGSLHTESQVLVALAEFARRAVEEEKLRLMYNAALDAPADPDREAAMASLEADYPDWVDGARR